MTRTLSSVPPTSVCPAVRLLFVAMLLLWLGGCAKPAPIPMRTDIAPVERAMHDARRASAPTLAPRAWLAARAEREALDRAVAADDSLAVRRAAERTIAAARVAEARAVHAKAQAERDAARRTDRRLHRDLQRTRRD